MMAETFGVVAILIIWFLIGLGPTLWLLPVDRRRLEDVLGVAPTFGFAIMGVIGFSFVRFIAPVRVWAWPATILLIIGSLILAYIEWRGTKPELRWPQVNRWPFAARFGLVLIGFVILASPMLLKGIQYTIFRSNPSDAYTYITLAETFRVADWKDIWAGGSLQAANLDAIAHLADVSPTALFNARVLSERHIAVGYSVTLSWISQLIGSPVYRFYYAFNILTLTATLPLAFILAELLKLPAVIKYLAGFAIVFCFWTLFIIENDSSAQLAAIPLLLLIVILWGWIEQGWIPATIKVWLLIAVVCAALINIYFPVLLIVLIGWAAYYALGIVQRTHSVRDLATPLFAGLLIPSVLLVTGQLDYLASTFANSFSAADEQQAFYPFGLELIRGDGLSAVWGLSDTVLSPAFGSWILAWLWSRVANEFGTVLTLAVAITVIVNIRKTAPRAERIILSLVASGCALSAYYFLKDNDRSAAKAFSYIYPYLILSACLVSNYLNLLFQPILKPVVLGLLGVWLAIQCAIGGAMPYLKNLGSIFAHADLIKPEQYELDVLVNYLDDAQPQLLLVNIPRSDTWNFAYYNMFVFSRFPVYFQSGLIIDNSVQYQNLWLSDLSQIPDYAVVLRSMDYIGPQRLGSAVAETKDLILYKITTDKIDPFLEAIADSKRLEQGKLIFPTLALAP